MQIPWYTIGLAVVVLVAAGFLVRRHQRTRNLEPEMTAQQLESLFERVERVLRLASLTHQTRFGVDVYRLNGELPNDVSIELEGFANQVSPLVRLTLYYPSLERMLRITGSSHGHFRHWLPRLRKTDTGEETFDDRFTLSSAYPDRTRALLSKPLREQMKRLQNGADRVVVTDRSLFVFTENLEDPEKLRRTIIKAVDIADRLKRISGLLGPVEDVPDLLEYERGGTPGATRKKKESGELTPA